MKVVVRSLALALLTFILLTLIYLRPGPRSLFAGDVNRVMSDGTDPTTLPFLYDRIVQVWRSHPSYLFYGSVYDSLGDGDRGTAYWFPWNERWLVLFYSNFVPLEQISTAFIATIIILNGLFMFALSRLLRWPYILSLALSIGWAFNCYTRARAKVHGALAGIYHLPLIFIALFLVVRYRSRRSLALAALALLLAGSVAHYYLMTAVFLSPFFLIFLLVQPEFKKEARRVFVRLVCAVLPLMMFLAWNRWNAVPPEARMTTAQSMNEEWIESSSVSPFLHVFRAFPIDYLSGDLSLGQTAELNPLRGLINEHILSTLGRSNAHERSNGIRWSILLLVAMGAVWLLKGKFKKDLVSARNVAFFLLFAFFSFWMSMGPEAPVPWMSPAYWIYSVDPHIRVANRAAINVHFSFLMIVGFMLAGSQFFNRQKWAPWALLAVMIFDYPPIQTMPMAEVKPPYAALGREHGPCGAGLFFPYINQWTAPMDYYQMLQRMRGSDCPNLSALNEPAKVKLLFAKFPPSTQFLSQLKTNPVVGLELKRLADCAPLSWIAFHPATPAEWALNQCRSMGWDLDKDLICRAPSPTIRSSYEIDKCL